MEEVLLLLQETRQFTAWLFADALNKVCPSRRFFVTQNGNMGTRSQDIQEGDGIFFIKGTYVPFILRPSTCQLGAWELLGESCVHGFMHGEALLCS